MLRLRRRPSAQLPVEAFPRGASYPFMLEREWTPNAAWEIRRGDLATFGRLAEDLHALAMRMAENVLDDDEALELLELGPVSERMRRARARGDEALIARLDFALEPVASGAWKPWLLELNGDTAGNLVEGALLQREWGQATGVPSAGDHLEVALTETFHGLPGPLSVLHHPGDPYIVNLARYLASLAPGGARVEYPSVPSDESGAAYKMFRWGRLWAGRFPEVGAWAERKDARIYEPAWSVLLQHKGLLPWMWRAAPGAPGVLPATLDGPSSLPDGGATGWAEKSFHGISGNEVSLADAGTPVPSARPGHVWQRRVAVKPVQGRYPILCAVLVRGRFAGAVMREDNTTISRDDIVAPIAVVGDDVTWGQGEAA
jgi:glutathionylspermidine synthase